jgi:hypothetical protein
MIEDKRNEKVNRRENVVSFYRIFPFLPPQYEF